MTDLAIKNDATNKMTYIAQQNGLGDQSAAQLTTQFSPIFAQAEELVAICKTIIVTDATQCTEIEQSRRFRLKLRELRIFVENVRKSLKEDSLRRGKAIDGIANVIKFILEPEEERLLAQEQFAERAEAARKAALKLSREETLRRFNVATDLYRLDEMPEETFQTLLKNSEAEFEAKAAAAQKAEAERIAAESARRDEDRRIRAENERLKKEKDEADKWVREEKARRDREAFEAAEAARKEREALEAKAKAERDAITAKAEQERRAAEAKARAEREAAAAAVRAEKEAREKAEAELEARRREDREKAEREAALQRDRSAMREKRIRDAAPKMIQTLRKVRAYAEEAGLGSMQGWDEIGAEIDRLVLEVDGALCPAILAGEE